MAVADPGGRGAAKLNPAVVSNDGKAFRANNGVWIHPHVEAVTNEVGYEDTGFFGRLLRRKDGLTPALYRKGFGAIRKALQADATD